MRPSPENEADWGCYSDEEILTDIVKNYLSQVNRNRPILSGDTLIQDFSIWLNSSFSKNDDWEKLEYEGIKNFP
jgi:hypothetical protein